MLKMRYMIVFVILQCFTSTLVRCEEDKQIKLEDIEQEALLRETDRSSDAQKELAPESTQHIQLSYGNNPQDVYVTPQPGRYAAKETNAADVRQQVYHLPKVHEADQTYTVPAKKTLIQPIIGGGQPIQPTMVPQPQYIYIPSPQAHHPYVSQAHAYVMVPYAHQQVSTPMPTPLPTPTIFTYANAPHHQPQPSYQALKSIQYNIPATQITPLQTSVDYKNIATIVPKSSLPSIATTSFRQYYSPGLEYHYTELVPATKLTASPSYAYHHSPTQNYHTSYAAQPHHYYQQPTIYKQAAPAIIDSFIPNMVSYARQQQFKNYYSQNYYSSPSSVSQQLFTPAQSAHYAQPYPSSQAYNTIAYSIPLPAYDHSKRSTATKTSPKSS